jgi:hypothetical protein
MCGSILSGITTSATAAQNAITSFAGAVQKGFNAFGRRIDRLTYSILPPTAAKIIAASLKALPVTLAIINMPTPTREIVVYVGALTSFFIGFRGVDSVLGTPLRKGIYRGIGNAMFILGVKAAKSYMTLNNTDYLANSFFYGVHAFGFWASSNRESKASFMSILTNGAVPG